MANYINNTLTKEEKVIFEAKLHWILFISLKALLTLFLYPIFAIMSAEYAVTTKRIIWKMGIISRSTGEMNLKKIENVQVDQSILGRILGYGSVTVVGTGGTNESFGPIKQPLEFRKAIQAQQDQEGA